MAIGSAVDRRGLVHVYDPKGRQLCVIQGGSKPKDGIIGYTGSTVSIRRGDLVHTYDEKGRHLSCVSSR